MKHITFVFLACIVFFTIAVKAQILNPGFENWDANGNPVDWMANNAPPAYSTVTKTSDAHSGSWALEGTVVAFDVFHVAPIIYGGPIAEGFSINFRPLVLQGYYKFIPVNNDQMVVQVILSKNGSYVGGRTDYVDPAGTYSQFDMHITYINDDIPDVAHITMMINNPSGTTNLGSKMIIDDLAWSGTTDLTNPQIINSYSLEQNYPNPFNPSTVISFSIPSSEYVVLKVYNVLGNEVATLVNEEKDAGIYEVEFKAEELASGIYLYKLQTEKYSKTRKMLFLK